MLDNENFLDCIEILFENVIVMIKFFVLYKNL